VKICVLQPDYSTSTVDYRHYDPPRDLAPLLPGHTVDHLFLDKRTTYRQLRACAAQGYDIFVNLCEGYLDWDVPSIDVIHALERLQLPYTGPTASLYDPPKTLMKYAAYSADVSTPAHRLITAADDLDDAIDDVERALGFPLFVKPAHAGDSLGVDDHALAPDADALRAQMNALLPEYPELLVESYVDGREFTVLVLADVDGRGRCHAFRPIEYSFPEGTSFKTYALKTSDLHPGANIPVHDDVLAHRLTDAARRVFAAFDGVGYARMDFRMDAGGDLYFLEVNFTCSVFYSAGYEGSADFILRYDGIGQAGFLQRIIAEGMARHARRRSRYVLQGNALAGYGIFASDSMARGAMVFAGEGRAHRIVTRRHVDLTWTDAERETFRQYAYPLSDDVYALWDTEPTAWAPQNHSCNPNTAFDGLNVVTLRDIAHGEELTLDYARSMNELSAPFDCRCGASNCRGHVTGRAENSVTAREQARRA